MTELTQMLTRVRWQVQDLLQTQQPFSDDDILLQFGLDSVQTIHLLIRLEEAFDIEFTEEDMSFENFSSVSNITRQIQHKIKVSPS